MKHKRKVLGKLRHLQQIIVDEFNSRQSLLLHEQKIYNEKFIFQFFKAKKIINKKKLIKE